MFWDTFPDKPKEAEKLTVTCYESRRCQVNGPFSFLFFPNFTLSTFSVSWKFSCYAILFPVATRLEAPSWYHFNCLEDGRDAGLITIREAQCSQLREPATWAVFWNWRLCLTLHARQDSASSVPIRVQIFVVSKGKINFVL